MGFPKKGNLKLQDIEGVYIKCIEEFNYIEIGRCELNRCSFFLV